jgi:hypothetical protein
MEGRQNRGRRFATEGSRRPSRSISHGLTRNFTEKTEAENWPRKEDTSFRAGCVSDGINMRFGKGPFDRLRDRGSFGTVSELVELAVKFKEGQNIFQHLFMCKI